MGSEVRAQESGIGQSQRAVAEKSRSRNVGACAKLGIEVFAASSPRAKGREYLAPERISSNSGLSPADCFPLLAFKTSALVAESPLRWRCLILS